MTIDLRTASVDEMMDWIEDQIPDLYIRHKQTSLNTLTIDAIAAVWRTELVGWRWARWGDGVWVAQRTYPASTLPKDVDTSLVETPDTGDELADRLRLTCLALAADRGIK